MFNRHEHYGDYLMVVPPNDTEVTETLTKVYSNVTVKRVVEMLLGTSSDEKTKATVAVVRTDGMLEVYPDEVGDKKMIVVPLSSYGIEGGFSFTFGFSNNQVAGIQLIEQTGTPDKYYNQAVRYTDEWGRFTRFGFWLLSDLVIDEADMLTYPLLTNTNYLELYNAGVQYFGCGFMNSDNGAGEPLLVNKDPLTNYIQTYELKMLSYYVGLYVFGTKFYTDNFIVNNPTLENKPYLFLYRDGTYYDLLEDLLKIKPTYSDVIELDSSNCSFDIGTLQYRFISLDFDGVTSWAIGNANKDLYVACNEPLDGFDIKKTHIRQNVLGIGGVGYFNKIFDFNSTIQLSMDFAYAKGRSVPIAIPMGINMSMGFEYRKGKGIGIDLSSTLAMSQVFEYQKGRMLDLDLDSTIAMSQVFEYRKSKNIGINLNSTIPMSLQFFYGIGDSKFYEINSLINMSNDFVYVKSKDIGTDVSATMLMENEFAYRRSKDIGIDIDSSLGMSMVVAYQRQMTYYNIDSALSMANNFAYRKSYDIGFSLNSTLGMSINVAYTKALSKASTPTISNKSVTFYKAWVVSTSTYWNAQDPSNRDTYVGEETLPSASGYAIGFAMRKTDGSFPETYTYQRVAKAGDSVSWKVTNNDAVSGTIYCKVGNSSYISYGTLAGGSTSSTLTRTITDGVTTVYAYIVVSGKSNSDVTSL